VDGEEKSRGYYSLRVRGLDIRNDSRPFSSFPAYTEFQFII
jgi:hypothetical protein